MGHAVFQLFFRENTTSFACLFGSGLKRIFHWKAQSLMIFRSLFRAMRDSLSLLTLEKIETSSAKSLVLETILFGKSKYQK